MAIKPIRKSADIPEHGEPAVVAAGMNDEIHGASEFAGFDLVTLGLVQGDKGIGVAVVDEGGRGIGMEMIDRRHGSADGRPDGKVGGLGAERLDEAFWGAAVVKIFGGIAEIDEIGNGIKDGDGLDGAAFAIDGILGIGGAGTAASGEHEAEVAACAAAGDAETIGIDAELLGAMANEANPLGDIVKDLHDGRGGLRDVVDGEDGVAAPEQGSDHPGAKRVGTGLPPAADHQDDAETVGIGWFNDVDGDGSAIAFAVNDAAGPLEGRVKVNPAEGEQESCEEEECGERERDRPQHTA